MVARGRGQNAVTAETINWSLSRFVIASHRVGAKRRPMTGSAKQSMVQREERMDCVVASLLAMTNLHDKLVSLEQRR
jgi:hypothetical protein